VNPEEFGYSVSAEVFTQAARVLGILGKPQYRQEQQA
jgi:hypothetical protein